jgi:hypothetical protein
MTRHSILVRSCIVTARSHVLFRPRVHSQAHAAITQLPTLFVRVVIRCLLNAVNRDA